MRALDEIARQAYVDIKLPMRIKSLNVQEHWRERHNRSRSERGWVRLSLKPRAKIIELPARICIVRYGVKRLDYDNLLAACKYIRDEIANILVPTDRSGSTDDDERLSWHYMQAAGDYAVRIIVLPASVVFDK